MRQFRFGTDDWPKQPLYRGSGSMNYPEGEMKYIWDGRGTAGPSAECLITVTDLRIRPKSIFRAILGWPELVLAREEIRTVEAISFGRYRFRSDSKLLDGACFAPTGSSSATFRAALKTLGLPLVQPPWRSKLLFKLKNAWNQVRWGGRLRRRHWRRERAGTTAEKQESASA